MISLCLNYKPDLQRNNFCTAKRGSLLICLSFLCLFVCAALSFELDVEDALYVLHFFVEFAWTVKRAVGF